MNERKYSLFTAICMVTGVVIGSGIFFKADDILQYTDGNVMLGILIFIIASISIVFGSLTISQLAMRTDNSGGIIAYAEEFVNRHTACAFGWFHLFIYLPSLIAIVAWVSAIYLCQLFGLNSTLETQVLIGVAVTCLFMILNLVSAKLGGYLQNTSMIIKLIPLVIFAVFGILFGDLGAVVHQDIATFRNTAGAFTWVAAFAPIAFSFDGWVVTTSLSHEIKNSRRNLPIALTVSPIIILLVYVFYFVGITTLLGADSVKAHGDASVYIAASQLFGQFAGKLVLVFIVISVLGTLNGLILGFIRTPYALAKRNMLPMRHLVLGTGKEDASYSVMSVVVAFLLVMLWSASHYFSQKLNMPGDVSEIAICVSYLNYILLYAAVVKLARKKQIKGIFKGYLNPILATAGSLIIFSGAIKNPMFLVSFLVFYGIAAMGYVYSRKHPDC